MVVNSLSFGKRPVIQDATCNQNADGSDVSIRPFRRCNQGCNHPRHALCIRSVIIQSLCYISDKVVPLTLCHHLLPTSLLKSAFRCLESNFPDTACISLTKVQKETFTFLVYFFSLKKNSSISTALSIWSFCSSELKASVGQGRIDPLLSPTRSTTFTEISTKI